MKLIVLNTDCLFSFAFALHRQFLTSDTATENFNNLRRTHGLMPYKTVSVILRFSNPMSMMKGILDLFLAQPFGGRSLFQRYVISLSKCTDTELV
jgi:hypothetical protein